MRIVVTGLIAQYPFGGVIWDYMNYVIGFRQAGHEVYYLEDSGVWPYDPVAQTYSEDCSENVRRLARIMGAFDMQDRWLYRNGANGEWFGVPAAQELLQGADLVANVSGAAHLAEAPIGNACWCLLDGDPIFTQLNLVPEADPSKGNAIRWHHRHLTFGLNVGHPDCTVPTGDLRWLPTVQPIPLDHWPLADSVPTRGYTTVMNWSSYAPKEWRGQFYGQKDLEFARYMALPQHVRVSFELAMGQGPGKKRPTAELQALGWHILEPDEVVPDHLSYRDFLRSSRAEWSIAKHGYVVSRSGWFSCRTACYLACGRPAVVQDTGWTRHLPAGNGVLAFSTLDEAAEQIARVERDYDHHARAARAFAEEWLDANRVCQTILDQCFGSSREVYN